MRLAIGDTPTTRHNRRGHGDVAATTVAAIEAAAIEAAATAESAASAETVASAKTVASAQAADAVAHAASRPRRRCRGPLPPMPWPMPPMPWPMPPTAVAHAAAAVPAAAAAAAMSAAAAPTAPTMAASRCKSQGLAELGRVFFVEHIEGRQADFMDLLLAEHNFVIYSGVLRRRTFAASPPVADALPANDKDNPAAPSTGTALRRRFRFEACFACDMAQASP